MRKIVAGKLQTGANFEGSKWGCVFVVEAQQ